MLALEQWDDQVTTINTVECQYFRGLTKSRKQQQIQLHDSLAPAPVTLPVGAEPEHNILLCCGFDSATALAVAPIATTTGEVVVVAVTTARHYVAIILFV